METISIIFWLMASAMLITATIPKINKIPICYLGEVFGIGGLVCAFNEYNTGSISQEISLVLVVGMLTVMVYCVAVILLEYTNNTHIRIR